MRRMYDEQKYLDFSDSASLKVVGQWRGRYVQIDRLLDETPEILELIHRDLEKLSQSKTGRESKFTSEGLFRCVIIHQLERTALRQTVVRIAKTPFLQTFARLRPGSVPDFTFLDKCIKAIEPETWQAANAVLREYGQEEGRINVGEIRTDSTVVESNIHYPTDSSLLWDGWRVITRTVRGFREESQEARWHRFHDRKVKKDYLFITRYATSGNARRQREVKRRAGRLIAQVSRAQDIGLAVCEELLQLGMGGELRASGLPDLLTLVGQVCGVAERALLHGEKVPACERVFSLFEPHTELIKRGKSRKPVEFGHSVWLTQTKEKFIVDYEVLQEKVPDTELLDRITERHRNLTGTYPELVAADKGFRSEPVALAEIEERVETLAIPSRSQRGVGLDPLLHAFRAGIEGSISVLKRAFRISVCFYRSFKTFATAVGMAIFCHNLRLLATPRR